MVLGTTPAPTAQSAAPHSRPTPPRTSATPTARPLGRAARYSPGAHADLRQRGARRSRLLLASALLTSGLLISGLLTGCGSEPTYPPYNGIIRVDNLTDTTTNEILYTFFVSPFGYPWTGDLLGGDLFPAESRSLGVFGEDYFDAEGDMELGDVIQWFDIFVGEGATTVFEVF